MTINSRKTEQGANQPANQKREVPPAGGSSPGTWKLHENREKM